MEYRSDKNLLWNMLWNMMILVYFVVFTVFLMVRNMEGMMTAGPPSRITLTCKASVCFLVIVLGKCNLVFARCSRGAADTRLHFCPVVKRRKIFLTSPIVTEDFEAFTKAELVWCKTTSDLLFAMAAIMRHLKSTEYWAYV